MPRHTGGGRGQMSAQPPSFLTGASANYHRARSNVRRNDVTVDGRYSQADRGGVPSPTTTPVIAPTTETDLLSTALNNANTRAREGGSAHTGLPIQRSSSQFRAQRQQTRSNVSDPRRGVSTSTFSGRHTDSRLSSLDSELTRIRRNFNLQTRGLLHADGVAEEVSYERGELIFRAQRLTERLEMLKHKLALCFQEGEEMARSRQAMAIRRQNDLLAEVTASRERRAENRARAGNSSQYTLGEEEVVPPQEEACHYLTPQIVLEQMAAVEADDAPEDFVCPITQCLMVDPVFTSDGSIYERAAITEWFRSFQMRGKKPTSPLTNLELANLTLTPSLELRKAIQSFLDESIQKQKVAEAAARVKRSAVEMTQQIKSGVRSEGDETSPAGKVEKLVDEVGVVTPQISQGESYFTQRCTYEEPSLRQLVAESAKYDVHTTKDLAAVEGNNQKGPDDRTVTSPQYDSHTIDVGELRREFQRRQQQHASGAEAINERFNTTTAPQSGFLSEISIRSHPLFSASLTSDRGTNVHHTREQDEVFRRVLLERSDGSARTLNPSLVALLTERTTPHRGLQIGSSTVARQHVETERREAEADAPIWSSAVVPLHEPNSRVLNLLRIRDDLAICDPPDLTRGDAGRSLEHGRAPIIVSTPEASVPMLTARALPTRTSTIRPSVPSVSPGHFASPTVNHSRTIQRLVDARRQAGTSTLGAEPRQDSSSLYSIDSGLRPSQRVSLFPSNPVHGRPLGRRESDELRPPPSSVATNTAATRARSLNARQGNRALESKR